MPCLNPEILYDIGKQIVEERSQEDVYKFAYSGRKPFQVMCKIFASVTTLEIYDDHYVVGWGKSRLFMEFQHPLPHSEFLMNQIGHSVKELHIDKDELSFFQLIINNIIARRQLITFTGGYQCSSLFLNQFLPLFSTSLKYVTIPPADLDKTFRDSMNLSSLTILSPSGYRYALYCCKTSSLKCSSLVSSLNLAPGWDDISPHLTSIEELILADSHVFMTCIDVFQNLMKYFSSLQLLVINTTIPKHKLFETGWYILHKIPPFVNYIKKSSNIFPPKVTWSLFECDDEMIIHFLNECKHVCQDFEFIESDPDCFCFRQNIQSDVTNRSTLFQFKIFE